MTLTPIINNQVVSASNNSIAYFGVIASGLAVVRQLIDRAVTFSAGGIDWFGDAYVDADGRSNSVVLSYLTTAEFNTNLYRYLPWNINNTTTNFTVATTTTSVTTITTTCTAVADHIINQIKYDQGGTNSVTVTINRTSGTPATLATKVGGGGGTGVIQTITFARSDYSDYLHAGDTYTIVLTASVGSPLFNKTTQSTSNSLFLFSSQTTVGSASTVGYYATAVTTTATDLGCVYHTIPANTFSATISSAICVPLIASWETGADIKFKLKNGSEDSGWLDCGTTPVASSFTAFTSQPTQLVVRMIPKSSSPTVYYPAIYGAVVRAE